MVAVPLSKWGEAVMGAEVGATAKLRVIMEIENPQEGDLALHNFDPTAFGQKKAVVAPKLKRFPGGPAV